MNAGYRTTHLEGITDLTLVADVRQGIVPGMVYPVSYVERLRRVLAWLNGGRIKTREALPMASPFTDPVGQFKAIHYFRFAVVSDKSQPARHQLFLNVTFDGGWEPYMRIIWGPLGSMLDLFFCNCVGYRPARQCSFPDYVSWVRSNEVITDFFYSDGSSTVGDAAYLRELQTQLDRRDVVRTSDMLVAQSACPARLPVPTLGAFELTLARKSLDAFHQLDELFPNSIDGSFDEIRRCFAEDFFKDIARWNDSDLAKPEFAPMLVDLKTHYDSLRGVPRPTPANTTQVLGEVQIGIHTKYPADVRDGVLILLRVVDVASARTWLATSPVTAAGAAAPADGIYRTLAITFSGLKRLQVPEALLAQIPHEFVAGMEARAGILGDVRGNHPEQWKLPRVDWKGKADAPVVDLAALHLLVVQLRTGLKGDEATDGVVPLARLVSDIDAWATPTNGLQVLTVQVMKLNTPQVGELHGRDHFGFADGFSQPTLTAPPKAVAAWDDRIETGELFLGHANGRGDEALSVGPLLQDGTFLVVRKLREYPERLEDILKREAERLKLGGGAEQQNDFVELAKAKLMGRKADGTPLAGTVAADNDFDYSADAVGAKCPFRAHVRLANPRTPGTGERHALQPQPRIVRRGMSYGSADTGSEKGVVFMTYQASIAEQFEVIQRWLAGGNSSGISSSQNDPLLGLPEAGKARIYRFQNAGGVFAIDLGKEPLVKLEWGVYAFVPSVAGLALLASKTQMSEREQALLSEPRPKLEGDVTPVGLAHPWHARLEDERARLQSWAEVRRAADGGFHVPGYGLLVGKANDVLAVLKDPGNKYSTSGYGERLAASGLGAGYLGMDDVGPRSGHRREAPEVNEAIERFINERGAFDEARSIASGVLKARFGTDVAAGDIDLIALLRSVLATLCTRWFGLPLVDDEDDGQLRSPGHLLTLSRHTFSPHPTELVHAQAKSQGAQTLEAVKTMLANAESRPLTALVRSIVGTTGLKNNPERQAITVAGVMLGFPPTVFGNLLGVLIAWTRSKQLWELQLDLLAQKSVAYDDARTLLRDTLMATMCKAPVPYQIWRRYAADVALGKHDRDKRPEPEPVVVGLASAIADGGDPMLMFGGERGETVHACPGYGMAMGVMLGILTALLEAGTLRPTTDPRVIRLERASIRA